MSEFKIFISLIISLSTTLFAEAQFNDSTHHYIKYSTTGIVNKTNSANSFVLSNALRYSLKKNRTALNSNNSWVYGIQKKLVTNNDFNSTLDFNILHKDSSAFYYWGLLNYDISRSLNINNRIQAGLGVAYNFIDNKNWFVNLSTGFLYEHSNIQNTDNIKTAYSTTRLSTRFRYRLTLSDNIVLDGTHFYQPSLQHSDDYIIKSVNALTVKVRKWLGVTAAANYNKISYTNRENLIITFGFTAENFF